MDIMSLFGVGNTKQEKKNKVLIDVSYFAQRSFHGYYKSGEMVSHISMRYTLLFTLLIRMRRLNIKPSTHEIILCYDGNNYWKKAIAPYYKCRRGQNDDGKDWEGYSLHMNSVREELIKYYPFKVLQFKDKQWYDKETDTVHISGIEADDVIAVLANRFSEDGDNVIIMTGDGDFTQLDYLDNISIYDFDTELIKAEHGCGYFDLIHKIVNGDSKDDVANINSRSNYWENKLDGERQVSAKKLAESCCEVDDPFLVLNEEQSIRFKENRRLKDFKYIPDDLVDIINEEYDRVEINPENKLYQFMYDLDVNDGLIQDNLKELILGLL